MKQKFKIAIIGAGWFGCHIASELLKIGFDIKIFERENDIFKGASGNSQNRLHLGYHYPRSHITREQSKKGFKLFKKNYPNFTKKIKNNLYAISNSTESLIDFNTYLAVLKNSKLKFTKLNLNLFNVKNIEGLIKCDEEYLDIPIAKNYFKQKLKNNIFFNYDVKNIKKIKNNIYINNLKFDFLINCSWQQIEYPKVWDLSYELCISLLYEAKKSNSNALTIMDGPFYTLYPWSKKIYNLYSVRHSRYIKTKKFTNIKNKIKKIKTHELKKIKITMEKEFIKYVPNFKKDYKFKKYVKTYRTLIDKKNDSRDYKIYYNKKIFNVLSGKIDHIFLALNDIKKCLKNFS